MTATSFWMHVDSLMVKDAAALWAGYDPARVGPTDSMRPSEVIASIQMLSAGIRSGELKADSSTNPFAMIGTYSDSIVSRSDLETFARKRGLFPAFLFDTLAPLPSTGREPIFEPPRLTTQPPTQTSPPRNPGGRPQEHDWDTFISEVVRRANLPDGLPDIQAELVREMLMWFQNKYDREPPESSVKERISKIYRHIAEAGNSVR